MTSEAPPGGKIHCYLTLDGTVAILGRMNAELRVNQSWWWLPREEWVAD